MKHLRKALAAILVMLIILPCVASASTHFTGYTSKKTYVYKRASTSSKKVSIAKGTKVYVIGTSGKFYKVQNTTRSATGYIKKIYITKKKPATTTTPVEEDDDTTEETTGTTSVSWKSKVVKLDWYKTGKNVLKRGGYGYLYDIATGIRIRVKRMGGTKHADMEPATASDTAKLKKIAGGTFSWTCHAVILQAGGKYVACSINTLPHGSQTIKDNNYNGQFCLHMVNSRTHGSNKVNPNHQACINKAYKWAHK